MDEWGEILLLLGLAAASGARPFRSNLSRDGDDAKASLNRSNIAPAM
jgi:hypothetical protein